MRHISKKIFTLAPGGRRESLKMSGKGGFGKILNMTGEGPKYSERFADGISKWRTSRTPTLREQGFEKAAEALGMSKSDLVQLKRGPQCDRAKELMRAFYGGGKFGVEKRLQTLFGKEALPGTPKTHSRESSLPFMQQGSEEFPLGGH